MESEKWKAGKPKAESGKSLTRGTPDKSDPNKKKVKNTLSEIGNLQKKTLVQRIETYSTKKKKKKRTGGPKNQERIYSGYSQGIPGIPVLLLYKIIYS